LAPVLGEHRLRIEALHMADPAVHEEPDHALCFWSEVRLAIGRGPGAIVGIAVALQHGSQRQAGKTQSHVGKKCWAGRRTVHGHPPASGVASAPRAPPTAALQSHYG